MAPKTPAENGVVTHCPERVTTRHSTEEVPFAALFRCCDAPQKIKKERKGEERRERKRRKEGKEERKRRKGKEGKEERKGRKGKGKKGERKRRGKEGEEVVTKVSRVDMGRA